LLTIFYLYKVLCSPFPNRYHQTFVVNCLQFFIFTRFFAVIICKVISTPKLWIAYNFLSLQGSLQWFLKGGASGVGCELLTIFYLYKVLCSVNCLTSSKCWLWIAYNFLSLQGSLQ